MEEDKVDGWEQKYPWENKIKVNPRAYGTINLMEFGNSESKGDGVLGIILENMVFSTSMEEVDKVKEWEDKMEREMFKGSCG